MIATQLRIAPEPFDYFKAHTIFKRWHVVKLCITYHPQNCSEVSKIGQGV